MLLNILYWKERKVVAIVAKYGGRWLQWGVVFPSNFWEKMFEVALFAVLEIRIEYIFLEDIFWGTK